MKYIIGISFIIIFFILLVKLISKIDITLFESGEERAGRHGEQFVSQIIREILNEKDVLLTNVKVSFEGKNTELDNVIINNRGVFIIEVKNYSGILIGDEDDFEWIKNKYTEAGNFYQKSVKNPIKQIKRQVYILSGYLKAHGFDVWIEGYVFFVEGKSPINSKYILNTQKDIDTVIHFGINNKLKKVDKEKIVEFIS